MSMNKYLDVSPEVAAAVAAGKPVVALESTIISHGMPYPQNVETALKVEAIIRENGAVPATIAILGGRLKAGLSPEEIEYLGKKGHAVNKASRRDLAVLASRSLPPGASAAYTAVPRPPWISLPIWKSWPTPPSWWCAPAPNPSWTWASPWSIWRPMGYP